MRAAGRFSFIVHRFRTCELLERRQAQHQAQRQQRPGRQLHAEVEKSHPQQQRAGRGERRAEQRRRAAKPHRPAQPRIDGQDTERAQQRQQRRKGRQRALPAQQHRHALEDREAQRHADARWVAHQIAERADRRLGDARQWVIAQMLGQRQVALGVPTLADRSQVAVAQQRQHAGQQRDDQQHPHRRVRAQGYPGLWPGPAPPCQAVEHRRQPEQQRQRPAQIEHGADADIPGPDRHRIADQRDEQRA